MASLHAVVYGHVQGVFFRAFTSRQAASLGLTGYVRNLRTKRVVEVYAEGEKEKLEKLLDQIKIGPQGARVERVDIDWPEYTGNYSVFSIRY
ncbi:MAG: acylphosphatase [Chloroflexi bacterium]|nr:acylphosphatase [Chloroflexota bacterium]